jgi:hypothetical protein
MPPASCSVGHLMAAKRLHTASTWMTANAAMTAPAAPQAGDTLIDQPRGH